MQDVLLDKKEELEKLNKSYDRVQKNWILFVMVEK